MRAVACTDTGGLEHLKVVDLPPADSLKNGEVKIKFLAGSLNHLDLWVLKGLPIVKYQFPHVLGADCVGEVLDSKSADFKAGDRVCIYPAASDPVDFNQKENLHKSFGVRGEAAPGVFREELVVDSRFVFASPNHLSNQEAAAVPLAYLTAWQMLREKAQLFPGEFDANQLGSVLVHAASSGVSQALINLLQSFGVKDIVCTSRSAEKLQVFEGRAGVQTLVVKDNIEDALKPLRKRFSIIFDHVGGAYFEASSKFLCHGGKLIICGSTLSPEAKIDLRYLFFKQLELLGSTMGSLKHFQEMLSWVDYKKLRPLVWKTFAFDEPKLAFQELMQAGQHGKIVLSP